MARPSRAREGEAHRIDGPNTDVVRLPAELGLTDAHLDLLTDLLADRVAERLQLRQRDDGGWLRTAERIAAYIDAPPSRVYALNSAGRIPIEHDGSTLIARKSDLDAWVRSGGGIRP